MSEEQLKAFLERVKGDNSLQEQLKSANDADVVVSIAKEAGFNVTKDDLGERQLNLSDADLERMLGGKAAWLAAAGDSCCGTVAQNPGSCTATKLSCGSNC